MEDRTLYLRVGTLDQLYYFEHGVLYDAKTMTQTNKPTTNLVKVLNLDPNITAPEEFTSQPVFVRMEDGFTVLVTSGEEDVEMNYIQSFDPETGQELNGNPFQRTDRVLAVVPFSLFAYETTVPGYAPDRLSTSSRLEPFNPVWYQRLLRLKDEAGSLFRIDRSPVNPYIPRTRMLIGQPTVEPTGHVPVKVTYPSLSTTATKPSDILSLRNSVKEKVPWATTTQIIDALSVSRDDINGAITHLRSIVQPSILSFNMLMPEVRYNVQGDFDREEFP